MRWFRLCVRLLGAYSSYVHDSLEPQKLYFFTVSNFTEAKSYGIIKHSTLSAQTDTYGNFPYRQREGLRLLT